MSSSGAPLSVDLPLPDFGDHMNGRMVDESRFSRRLSGSERLVEARGRLAFTFGYKDLDSDTAELLIEILSTRLVTLTPRTARDSDPSGAGAEEIEYQCRVVGRIPFTRHLTLGYRITVQLEETLPGATIPQDDLSPPPYLGGAFPSVGGVSPTDPEPSPEPDPGGGQLGDPECVVHRQGYATMLSGTTSVVVVPDPPFPEPIFGSDIQIDAFLTYVGAFSIGTIWVPRTSYSSYSFTIKTTAAPTVNVEVGWRATQIRAGAVCHPCWVRNRWHSIALGAEHCAPFPNIMDDESAVGASSVIYEYGGKLYISGFFGSAGTYLKVYTVPVWDEALQIFTGNTLVDLTSSIPGGVNGPGCLVGTRLYFLAPTDTDPGHDPTRSVLWYYDVVAATWTRVGDTTFGDSLYLMEVGGDLVCFMCNNDISTPWASNPGADTWHFGGATWSAGTACPVTLAFAGTTEHLGSAYFCGGIDYDEEVASPPAPTLDTVWAYTGSSWFQDVDLPAARARPAVCSVPLEGGGAFLHVVGGQTNHTVASSAQNNNWNYAQFEYDVPKPFPGDLVSNENIYATWCRGRSLGGIAYFGPHTEYSSALPGSWAKGQLWAHAPHYHETFNPFTGKSSDDL